MGSVGDYWKDHRDYVSSLLKKYCDNCGRKITAKTKAKLDKLPDLCIFCQPDKEAKNED